LRKILKGVGYGIVIGGSGGAIIGYMIGDHESGGLDSGDMLPGLKEVLMGAVIGAVIGGIIGGIIAAS
jgi:hypothetical protein